MDHEEVGRHWDENAEAWTRLARAGYDVARGGQNTPTLLEMLPAIDGLSGLDVGCGEGHNTRLVSERGARMTGIDISKTFVRHAKERRAASQRASGTRGQAPWSSLSRTPASTSPWPL